MTITKFLGVILVVLISIFCPCVYSSQPVLQVQPQLQRDPENLKEEVSRLRKQVSDQIDLTSKLLERTTELINTQSQINIQLRESINTLNTDSFLLKQQTLFKDAFILNMDGSAIAFIDNGLKLYDYNGGNFIGWIKPDTNEVIRNYDNSVVAVIENDFLIDETGYPIGSIERSETMRWDREKFYGMTQKTPASHFFARPQSPRQFILSSFRASEWSNKKLEDVLFFSEKNVQKLK